MCTADLGFTGGKNDIGAGTDTDFIGACAPALRVSVPAPTAKTDFCAPTFGGHARTASLCSVLVQPVNIHGTDGPTQQVNAGRVTLSRPLAVC